MCLTAKDMYFNGYSDNRSVQENFDLIISSFQESADKYIPFGPLDKPLRYEVRFVKKKKKKKKKKMQRRKRLTVVNLGQNLKLWERK